MSSTPVIAAECVRQEWRIMGAWSDADAAREMRRFHRHQPVLNAYVFAMLDDQGPAALTFGLMVALVVDRVYRRALNARPAPISEPAMESAAEETVQRFAELTDAEPSLAYRRMLFERDLAVPALVTELLTLLMEEGAQDPDIEPALGALFITALGVAKAYERAHGMAEADVPKSSLAEAIEAHTGRPLPKIGRNEPCMCGSGRKFKKCCGQRQAPPAPRQKSHAEELFSQYIGTVDRVWSYVLERERDPDARWLRESLEHFERRFHPGEPGGVPDSLYLSYGLFDLVIPRCGKTMGELYLERKAARLEAAEGERLRYLCCSYPAFYELVELRPAEQKKRLRELVTGTERLVSDFEDACAEAGEPGEIWLCRLLGPLDDALAFMSPLIYPPDARAEIESVVLGFLGTAERTPESLRATMKLAAEALAEYIRITSPPLDDDEDDGDDWEDLESGGEGGKLVEQLPLLVDAYGNPLVSSKPKLS